jgi:fibro-slime domain-containing protein
MYRHDVALSMLLALAVTVVSLSCGTNNNGGGTNCGNGVIDTGETCDDKNTASDDGCSSSCQVENGWTCSTSATSGVSICIRLCGNGVIDSGETCDDKNAASNDGCSSSCQVENGWTCSTSATSGISTCTPSCGDTIVVGNEGCDDGNDIPYDGCYQCQAEPSCDSGECPPTCGDGIVAGDEACDDGNTADGDGCSADCTTMGTVATGWNCSNVSSDLPSTLDIPVVFRDFKSGYSDSASPHCATPDPTARVVLTGEGGTGNNDGSGHPDFECYAGNAQTAGLVEYTLGSNSYVDTLYGNANRYLPVFHSDGVGTAYGRQLTDDNSAAGDTASDAAHYFNQWYRNVDGINRAVVSTLTFNWDTTNEVYTFDSGLGFFPLDGLGWGNTPSANEAGDSDHNFHFTSEVRYWFKFQGEQMTLTFSGDDDVWIFINHKLAVDLGGLHPRTGATLTINTDGSATVQYGSGGPVSVGLDLVTNHVYEMTLFHAERHTTQSNFILSLGNFVKTTTSCTPICGDGIEVGAEQCDDGNTVDGDGCSSDCEIEAPL